MQCNITFLSWMTAECPYLELGPLSDLAWTSFHSPGPLRSVGTVNEATMCLKESMKCSSVN